MNFLIMFWKPLAVIGVGAFLWWQVNSWVTKYNDMKLNYESELSKLVVQRDKARIEAEAKDDALEAMKAHGERMELLLTEAITRIDASRAEAEEREKIFNAGHDLDNLARKKAGLIERLANNATARRMGEIESALND